MGALVSFIQKVRPPAVCMHIPRQGCVEQTGRRPGLAHCMAATAGPGRGSQLLPPRPASGAGQGWLAPCLKV